MVHMDWAGGSLWDVQHREGVWSMCVRYEDGPGRGSCSRRGLREPGEGSLGSVRCEGKGFAGWWVLCRELG